MSFIKSNAVYENDLDERANTTNQKPKHKDIRSPDDPIYQNVFVNTSQADTIDNL